MMKQVFILMLFLLSILSCATSVPGEEAAKAYYNLGNAHVSLKEYDKAALAYLKAIELDETLVKANFNLARVYIDSGYLNKGIEILDSLLKEDPENGVLLKTIGYAYYLKGKNEEAIKAYEKVLLKSKYDENALYNSGIILYELNKKDKALEVYLRLYSISPDDESLLLNLGLLEAELKKYPEAIKYLESYRKKKPGNTDVEIALGDSYAAEKEYGKSLVVYDSVLSREKKNAEEIGRASCRERV